MFLLKTKTRFIHFGKKKELIRKGKRIILLTLWKELLSSFLLRNHLNLMVCKKKKISFTFMQVKLTEGASGRNRREWENLKLMADWNISLKMFASGFLPLSEIPWVLVPNRGARQQNYVILSIFNPIQGWRRAHNCVEKASNLWVWID